MPSDWALAGAVLLAVVLPAAAVAVALSFRLTHRFELSNPRSPAEVGLEFEDVSLDTEDGLRLRGWWIPCRGSERAIVQLHGHSGSMDPDLGYVPAWHAAGYNVLMFDFRAHGRSEGRLSTFGYLECLDVLAAARWARQARGMRRVALVGFSLGAMAALLAAPLSPDVDAVVADGSPARIRSAITVWGLERGVPRWLARVLSRLVLLGASLRLRANLFRYEPVRWVGRIAPRPLLIIHGDLDQYCPDFEELRAAAVGAELWRLPDVGHVQASQVYPEEYRRRVVGFLDRVMTSYTMG